jgi:Domain of unknown function (DUF1905)
MQFTFAARVIEWRGPSPFYYVPLPDEESADVREVAAMATYGWGVIPVVARIGDIELETSLFPKDGGYLLPLKDAVRKPQQITVGDEISIDMTVRLDRGRPADPRARCARLQPESPPVELPWRLRDGSAP